MSDALKPFIDAVGYYERQTGPRFLRLKLKDLITDTDIKKLVSDAQDVFVIEEWIPDEGQSAIGVAKNLDAVIVFLKAKYPQVAGWSEPIYQGSLKHWEIQPEPFQNIDGWRRYFWVSKFNMKG